MGWGWDGLGLGQGLQCAGNHFLRFGASCVPFNTHTGADALCLHAFAAKG